MYQVLFKRLEGNEDIAIPRKMSEWAAGFDLQAAVAEPVVLEPGERKLIPTGFAMAMPSELEAQIRPIEELTSLVKPENPRPDRYTA